MKTVTLFFGLILAIGLALGCSGGGSAPVVPDTKLPTGTSGISHENTYIWGIWDVTLNPESKIAEITPIRGADFTCDVVRFLQPPIAMINLITVQIDPSSEWSTGHIIADVTIRHPFPSLQKFTGFDVRTAVIGNGSIVGMFDGNIVYGGGDSIELLNADGYTRWFNPTEFTSYGKMFGFTEGKYGTPGTDFSATLNPYKYYCDNLGATDEMVAFFDDPSCPNPRGVFKTSSVPVRRFDLQFPLVGGKPLFHFQYAVVASWIPPSPNPPQNIPDDFSLAGNCGEAYLVDSADQSEMYYTDPSNKGGTLKLSVRVYDHQGVENPNGILGEISGIALETPDGPIIGGLAEFDPAALSGALVSQDDLSATFLLEVTNVDPSGQGEFPVLIMVTSADPSDYSSGMPGFDYPDGKLAAYAMGTVSVGPGIQGDAPVAIAEIVTPPPYCPGDAIEFDATASYDPDGFIVSYEWDFNGDGVYGDPYDSGTDSNPILAYADSGAYMVDVRVTDNEALTDTLDDPLALSVGGPTWVDDDAVSPFDGTFDHPWPTIQEGIDNANDDCGEKWVRVKDGTYVENIKMISDITVEGYSDPAPLITTIEGSENHMVDFSGAQNARIKHFRAQPRCKYDTVNSIYADGIYVASSPGNVVDDIEFLDNPGGETCRYAVGTHYWGAGSCTINNIRVNGYHKAAYGFISASGPGVTVTNCVLLNITFMAVSGMGIINVSDGGATALVAKNVIGHATFSEAFPETAWVAVMSVSHCSGGPIRNTLIFDINNNLGDTGWTWGLDCSDAENMTVEHNTVSGLKGPAWIYGHEVTDFNTDPSGTIYRDHIVANLTAGMMNWRWAYLGMWGADLPVDYSCAYNVGNAFYTGIHEAVEGVGFVYTNPEFLNIAGDDYRVAGTSPCHGNAHDGTDMGAYGGTDPLTWVP
ncbi:MAG: PKD domain-containing protein [bacterium]